MELDHFEVRVLMFMYHEKDYICRFISFPTIKVAQLLSNKGLLKSHWESNNLIQEFSITEKGGQLVKLIAYLEKSLS